MSKSLIKKYQLDPNIQDLVGEYGSGYFLPLNFSGVTILESNNFVKISGDQTISGIKTFVTRPLVNGTGVLLQGEAAVANIQNVVYTTGNQTINGVKTFTSLPNVNGIPLSTGFGGGSEYTFPSNLTVTLTPGKTFGKYQNGDTIEAAGLTTSQVIQLAITEKINPTVNLSVSPSSMLLSQTSVNNQLTFSFTLNNPGATLTSTLLQWKRASEINWTTLASNPSSPFTHTHTNTVGNNNAYNYRYIVTDSQGSITTGTANVSFLYGNYFGYNSATSLTTIAQIEALGNQILSDGKSRTQSSVTAGIGLYTYYAYKSDAGDLTSIIQDGAAPVLGAFTKQNDIAGININGGSVTYRVYRSNATQAFTNNTLAFS